jgi:TM2 domain-containing membrane protein YozV
MSLSIEHQTSPGDPEAIADPKTKITTEKLLRLAGFSALLAGICYVLVGIFHPPNVPASVTTTRWAIVHVIACAMCFFGVLGVAGLYARQAKKSGWLGLVGFLLLSLWLLLIMGFSFVEAFVLPRLATADPKFIAGWMGMFNSNGSKANLAALPTLWTLSGPVYILGGLLFGIATFRAAVLPRWAGALLAVAAVLSPVGALLSNGSQPKTAVPVGLALAWLGYALWSERRPQTS